MKTVQAFDFILESPASV